PAAGTVVRSSADGEVLFAGAVGGALHVTIRHADGLRTSYSFLASVGVRRGQTVRAGDAVGTSGGHLHFGVRDPAGAYLDPMVLFTTGPPRVRLVPGADEGEEPLREEAGHLRSVVAAAEGRLRLLAHYGEALRPESRVAGVVHAVDAWRERT